MSGQENSNRYAGKVIHMYLPQDGSITKEDVRKISNRYGRTDSNLMLYIFRMLKNNIDVTNIPKLLSSGMEKSEEDTLVKIDFNEEILRDLDKLISIMSEKMGSSTDRGDFILKIVNHFITAQKKQSII